MGPCVGFSKVGHQPVIFLAAKQSPPRHPLRGIPPGRGKFIDLHVGAPPALPLHRLDLRPDI